MAMEVQDGKVYLMGGYAYLRGLAEKLLAKRPNKTSFNNFWTEDRE